MDIINNRKDREKFLVAYMAVERTKKKQKEQRKVRHEQMMKWAYRNRDK